MYCGRLALVASASLTLVACGNALSGPQSLAETLEQSAEQFNRKAPNLLGDKYGSTQVSSRVEGADTLVMRFANAPVGDRTFDPNAVRRILRSKVCDIGALRNVIDRGGRLKIEIVSHIGAEFPPVLFSRC